MADDLKQDLTGANGSDKPLAQDAMSKPSQDSSSTDKAKDGFSIQFTPIAAAAPSPAPSLTASPVAPPSGLVNLTPTNAASNLAGSDGTSSNKVPLINLDENNKTPPPASNASLINLSENSLTTPSATSATIATAPSTSAEVTSDQKAIPHEGLDNIFSDLKAQKPEAEKNSKIITSIIAEKKPQKSILGPAPLLESTIEEDKLARTKKKLHLIQFLFTAVLLGSLGVIGYFYTQLSPQFDLLGTNVTQQLTNVNTNLHKLQTNLNKYNILNLQLKLNEFSYQSDRFVSLVQSYHDASKPIGSRTETLANLEETKKILPVILKDIKDLSQKDLVIKTFPSEAEVAKTDQEIKQQFETDLRLTLQEDRKKFGSSSGIEDLQNIKLIDNALKLVGNTAFFNNIQKISVENFMADIEDYQNQPDAQKEKVLRETINKILGSTQSDLALIADLKQKRIDWTTIIRQIETETKNVDKNYGQPVLYEKLGGILYTGYEFDATTNKIVLSGTTKTMDGSNFTLISNLLDQLEGSLHFENVEDRSYSKNESNSTESYALTNFKIDLKLEEGFSNKSKPLSLESAETTKSGIKR